MTQIREVPAEFLILKEATTWGFRAGLCVKFRREYESGVMGLRPELIRRLILIEYWMRVERWIHPLGKDGTSQDSDMSNQSYNDNWESKSLLSHSG